MRKVGGPVHDLAATMSKLMTLNMSLDAVVCAVTEAPAEIMGEKDWCRLDDQRLARARYSALWGTNLEKRCAMARARRASFIAGLDPWGS